MVSTLTTAATYVRIAIGTMIATFRTHYFTIHTGKAVATDIATISTHLTAVRTNPCAILTPSTASTDVFTVITGS